MIDRHDNYSESKGKTLAKYTMAVTVRLTGVAAHKIRRFEEFGLCIPARTNCKQRLYSDNDLEVIKEIAVLEKEGVNLPGVKTILAMRNPGDRNPPSLQTTGY